jgi:hypothetical protein
MKRQDEDLVRQDDDSPTVVDRPAKEPTPPPTPDPDDPPTVADRPSPQPTPKMAPPTATLRRSARIRDANRRRLRRFGPYKHYYFPEDYLVYLAHQQAHELRRRNQRADAKNNIF